MVKYIIINKEGFPVWRGPAEKMAHWLALRCEQFPEEHFRVKVCRFYAMAAAEKHYAEFEER